MTAKASAAAGKVFYRQLLEALPDWLRWQPLPHQVPPGCCAAPRWSRAVRPLSSILGRNL